MSILMKILGAAIYAILTRLVMMVLLAGACAFALRSLPPGTVPVPDIGRMIALYQSMGNDRAGSDFGSGPATGATHALADAQAMLLGGGDSGAQPPQIAIAPEAGGAMSGLMNMVSALAAQGMGQGLGQAMGQGLQAGGANAIALPPIGDALGGGAVAFGAGAPQAAQPKGGLTELQKLRLRNYPRHGLGATVPGKPMARMKTVKVAQ